MGSKQYLEERHGLDIYGMAFPNGDYSERDIALLKAAGYQYALSLDYGFNTAETDKFRLKRLSVNDADQQDELIVKASGVWWFFKTWNGKRQGLGKKPTLKPEKESTKSAANSF